jgi:hypothetical protein
LSKKPPSEALFDQSAFTSTSPLLIAHLLLLLQCC